MAPNVKAADLHPLQPDLDEDREITEFLDKQSDTNGLSNIVGEDWTNVKHSERKKRDRILKDGVALKLMQKSDYEGFKRFFSNVGFLLLTAYAIARLDIFQDPTPSYKIAIFIPLYLFYGFQFQCFAFAGQHEFLHGNAWKTKWINDVALFVVGTVCFEFGKHERVMHKQHHTYTNNIDKDPELTSFYSRETLEDPRFRNVAANRHGYFRQFLYIWETLMSRLRRLVNSARGIAVDYSGSGWSMDTPVYSKESGIMRDLQIAAQAQLSVYLIVFCIFGRTPEGLQNLVFWWIAPVLVGYPAVNYVRNLEHADCEVSKEMNCLRNTRTVESNFIIRHLLWNTNFHVEHHCYPMVPFFNLPKLHELLDPHIIHNECKDFTTQNWTCVKSGGWIDQQGMNQKKEAKAE